MSALVIRDFGSPLSVLELSPHAEQPPLEPRHARVNILASPINPADLNWIEGTYGKRPALPATPGTEAVGEIAESDDPAFPPGTRVIFLGYAHGWQSQRWVATDELLAVPSDVPLTELAMLKVNPATAWRMLHDFTTLAPGDVVLQNAANSAVGQCVIQIARALGLRTINFVRRPENADDLLALGADLVLRDDEEGKQQALDYLKMQGKSPTLALNAVGGESALRQCDLLADGGIQVTYGAMSRRPLTIPNKYLIFRGLRFTGFWLSPWLERASASAIRATYQPLIDLIRAGQLRTRVDSMHPLSEHSAALARLQAIDRRGKVLFAAGANPQ